MLRGRGRLGRWETRGSDPDVPAWSDRALDAARRRGDPTADGVIAALEDSGRYNRELALLARVERGGQPLPEGLGCEVREYLEAVHLPDTVDWKKVRTTEQLFETFGTEILFILGIYALPSAFAAAKGVQVVYRTADLRDHPLRRLWETCQFVIDVLEPGGLGPAGRGVVAAQKVRLFHAHVRYALQHNFSSPDGRVPPTWQLDQLGLPVNQEDMAGTLMDFTMIVLDGLGKLGIELTPLEQEAYVYTWHVIGGLLGVEAPLRPATPRTARQLAAIISARQLAESCEGRELTAKLLEAFAGKLWWPFHGLPRTFLRLFLARDPYEGRDVAAWLGVRRSDWTVILVPVFRAGSQLHDRIARRLGTSSWLVRRISRTFLRMFLDHARTGGRARFYVPDHMRDGAHARSLQHCRTRAALGGTAPAL